MTSPRIRRNPARLNPDQPMMRALRTILVRQAEWMFSFGKGILSGPDVEAVHDMRVAARRLRAVLRLFPRAFDRDRLKAQIAVLSGVIRALGKVRDCDIIIRNLEGLGHLLDGDPHGSLEDLIARQRLLRQGHAAALERAVRGLRDTRAKERFLSFVRGSMRDSPQLRRSVRETAAPLIAGLLRDMVSRRREVVGHPGRIEVLHRMRIGGRPLRYVMEAFEPAFGKPFSKCLREVKDFLDVAGEIHDCDVMIGMLSGRIGSGAGDEHRVKIAKLLAAQRASRRRLFAELRDGLWSLDRGKFRKKLIRSIE